jgi:hypothetical protein
VLAPGCEYLTAVLSAVLGVWALLRSRRHWLRVARELALGAAVPLLLVGWYHTVCFGAPWETGYAHIVSLEFAGQQGGLFGVHPPTLEGLFGLLLGRRRGLLYIAPIALVGLVGLVRSARRKDGAVAAALAGFVVLLFLNAGYYMWWGGAAAGPRHLVPALGVLAFGVAAAWEVGWARPLVVCLALVSFANVLALSAVGLEAPERGDILRDYAYRLLLEGKIAHMSGATNLAIELGLSRAASLGPLLAWVLVGARLLARRAEAPASGE